MDISDSSTVTISLAALASTVATLISLVTAWVTLRMTVKHQASAIEKLARETDENHKEADERIRKIERWRDRAAGAAQASKREDTDRIMIRTAEAKSDLYPKG